MLQRLHSNVPGFRERLGETIAWCSGQPLESDPLESIEIKERRRLGAQAAELSRRSFISNGPEFWKSHLSRRASRLFERARLPEIVPLSHQLRSHVLDPGCAQFPSDRVQQFAIVEGLATRRAEQFRREHGDLPASPVSLQDGKLLLYSHNESLFDGAAQYASKGFFSVDNIPPWDTWVCIFEQYLVSWVAPKLVELANLGIEVNPEKCILWAPET